MVPTELHENVKQTCSKKPGNVLQPGTNANREHFFATGEKISQENRKQPGKLRNQAGFLQPGRVLSEWPAGTNA